MPRTMVVIPTYNESENLRVLTDRLLALDPPIDVLVVDDASPDGTGDLADTIATHQTRLHVLHRSGPRGYAAASREGMRWALNGGYDVVGTMDADLSHDPAALPGLVEAVVAGADLAIGSRYVDGGELVVDWGPVRRMVSVSGSGYARIMTGSGVRDCTSGFRCYRSAALAAIPFEMMRSEGYSFLIEVLAALSRAHARVSEVPIRYVDRQAGKSKISRKIVVEALVVTTRVGLQRLLRV
jgi:dolichol-phosphate mannosyltransferase